MTLMYKQQTLIVGLNFTKMINLFFKSDLITDLTTDLDLVNNNVVPGSTKMLIQKHVALGKIRFCDT